MLLELQEEKFKDVGLEDPVGIVDEGIALQERK